jgi:hypothetical protein
VLDARTPDEILGYEGLPLTSADVHRKLFPDAPQPRPLEELKEGVKKYVKSRHGRR